MIVRFAHTECQFVIKSVSSCGVKKSSIVALAVVFCELMVTTGTFNRMILDDAQFYKLRTYFMY